MLKSEMAEYASRVIKIVQKHEPASALFNPLFEALCAKKPEIKLLALNYGVDTERLKLQQIKEIMMLTISSLKLNVKRVQFSSELDLHVVQNAIDAHLRYFNRCRNDKEVNHKIRGFLNLMQSDKEFVAAIDKFGLRENIREIEEIYAHYNKVLANRVKRLAKRPKFSTQEVIKELHVAIDNLFKGIEVAQLIYNTSGVEDNSTVDYTPLINKLRQLSDMFYKSYAIRKAKNRRNLEKGDEADMEQHVEELVSDAKAETPDTPDTSDTLDTSKTPDASTQNKDKPAEISSNGAYRINKRPQTNTSEERSEVAASMKEQSVAPSAKELAATVSSNGENESNQSTQKNSPESSMQLTNAIQKNGKPDKPNKLMDEDEKLAKRMLLLRAGPPCKS